MAALESLAAVGSAVVACIRRSIVPLWIRRSIVVSLLTWSFLCCVLAFAVAVSIRDLNSACSDTFKAIGVAATAADS